jgi:hypothetical protein
MSFRISKRMRQSSNSWALRGAKGTQALEEARKNNLKLGNNYLDSSEECATMTASTLEVMR